MVGRGRRIRILSQQVGVFVSCYSRQGKPITVEEWARESDNRVAHTHVGAVEISTVWLGLDHRMYGNGPPLIFETMLFVFGGAVDHVQERYSTEAEALAGHQKWVTKVRAGAT